ncbi:MAG: PAS domain S-box protein [Nitrospirae bacterium]|nr:PAS domain S-box protein [Nitrospirota bacterium]
MGKEKCWEFFRCGKEVCPAYKSRNLRCWLFTGTLCRDSFQEKFIEKIEMCIDCEIFNRNLDVPSMRNTCEIFNDQLKEYRRIVDERDRELENIGIELSIGLSEVFEALKMISEGDPLVRVPETSNIELISKLKHLVNLTAQNIEEIVELSHEFAIGLAEHFDVLHRVSRADLNARVSDNSNNELLKALGRVTNQMIASVSREINERRKAEEELRQSERKYRVLIENLPQKIFLKDRNSAYISCNENYARDLGISPQEVIGRNDYDFFTKEIADKNLEEDRRTMELGRAEEIEDKYIIDGEERFIKMIKIPVKDEEGKIIGVQGISWDITSRKKAEEALRASEEKYRVVFETTGTAIIIVEDDMISMVNTEFEKLSGYSKEEVEGKKSWREFIIKEDLERIDKYYILYKIDPHFVPDTYEVRACDRYGNIKNIFMRIALIPNTKKMVVSLLDITEHKKAEEKLRISFKEKGILLREVHHRTKNNLQVILSLLDLQSLTIGDRKMLGAIKDIQNRIRSISMVHEKLYQSKDLSNVNLKDYVQELADALLKSYEGSKHRISLILDIDNIFISLDTITTCGLIINELLSNSLKYAFPNNRKGKIKLALRKIGREGIELQFSDNGIGLPEGLDFKNTKSLGLKLVQWLAEDQLDGEIILNKEEGTEFLIKFRELTRK